jgi:hypothetical protein
MVDRVLKARQFRERAVEFRKLALGMEQGRGREALLEMADECDRIATQSEKSGEEARAGI